jgi:murein DD-endopeptidase MepM/ murein hydrolase activator NlpD
MSFGNDNNKYFSFMLVPPSGSKTFSIRIPIWLLKIFLGSFVLLIISIGTVLFYTTKSSIELVQYKQMKTETLAQRKLNAEFKSQLNILKDEVESLMEKEAELEGMIGDKKSKYRIKKRKLKKLSKIKAFKKEYSQLVKKDSLEELKLFLEAHLTSVKKSITKHAQKIQHNKQRFAYTPSIWPVYGRIRSKFGWRIHPLTGKRRFHKGIDIPCWSGAPIKSSADGVIKYAGWSGTFGRVVIIDHSFGYRTIYAHASQLLVRKGEYIKKGQIIAQVGTSGLSTGSHVHYEIRRWDKAVNPKTYLDLDMFTASTRIW